MQLREFYKREIVNTKRDMSAIFSVPIAFMKHNRFLSRHLSERQESDVGTQYMLPLRSAFVMEDGGTVYWPEDAGGTCPRYCFCWGCRYRAWLKSSFRCKRISIKPSLS